MTIANFRMILFQIETVYEKLDWRSKELKKNLYYLPLDLKILIFQLAIQKNMISWEIDHKTLMWSIPSKVVNIKSDFHFQLKIQLNLF